MSEATTLRDLLVGALARHGAKTCFLRRNPSGWGVWTYADVDGYVRQFSAALRRLGVQKGDRIAILSENRPEWAVAFITAVCHGAVAVPLDRHLTPPEVTTLLAHSEARFVVAPSSFGKTLGDALRTARSVEKVLSMDLTEDAEGILGYPTLQRLGEEEARARPDARPEALGPDDLACIVYTSGTTGQPMEAVTHFWFRPPATGGLVARLGLTPLHEGLATRPAIAARKSA